MMDEISKNYLAQIAKNQNELLKILKNIEKNNKEEYEDIGDKLAHILSTSISMMQLSEQNINEMSDTIARMRGIQNLTSGNINDFFSPIQEIMFNRIFEIISMEKDISITNIKNDFLIYTTKEIGILRIQEEEQDRKIKEIFFIKCFHYFNNTYALTLPTSLFILSYFDMYLIFTTTKNYQRTNGLISIIHQLYHTTQKFSTFDETIPKI